ncbi:hypothetical protein EDC01DRAFT_662257 [Geopyxis carbonaria]|nr:hypothetical protein EDC01DRAFT_662257 [Geopyxis carbonaria]
MRVALILIVPRQLCRAGYHQLGATNRILILEFKRQISLLLREPRCATKVCSGYDTACNKHGEALYWSTSRMAEAPSDSEV